MEIPFHAPERFYKKYKSQSDKIFESVCTSGQFFHSKSIDEFEKKLASCCNRKFAVSTGSCTSALHFSLLAIGIKTGDKIIVPAVSFIATASAVLATGAEPVFADIDPMTGLIDMNHVEKILLAENIKAVIPVDLYGSMVDPSAISALQHKFSIPVIVDAAQSIGSSYQGIPAGNPGTISCISFDPTKIIHAFGSGGAVLTNDENVANTIRSLRYHGKYNDDFTTAGFNSRMNTVQIELLFLQLNHLDEIVTDRRETADYFISEFKKSEYFEIISSGATLSNFHKFVIKTKYRDAMKIFLSENGISTMIHYGKALYKNKLFDTIPFIAENIIYAENFCNEILSLPLHTYMTEEEKKYLCQIIKQFKPSL